MVSAEVASATLTISRPEEYSPPQDYWNYNFIQ